MKAKQVPEAAAGGEVDIIAKYIGAALRPYQVKSRTRPIFPANYQIGPKLEKFKIRVFKLKPLSSLFTDIIVLLIFIVIDFLLAVNLKPVIVVIRPGLANLFEIGVFAGGNKGLPVKLNGKVRGNAVIQPNRNVQGFLLKVGKDVAIAVCQFHGFHILEIFFQGRVSGMYSEGESIKRPISNAPPVP